MDFFLSNFTTTISPSNTTSVVPTKPPEYVGFICLTVSVLFFGSNYLPVKAYNTGDGMFFQLMLTSAIWTVGFIVNAIRGFPKFFPLPMLGGFFWSTGNLNTVIIIKLIGLGLGNLFWNTVLLILGWAIARFGWFGVNAEKLNNPTLNYIGVALAAMSGVFYLFVKSEIKNKEDQSDRRSLVTNEVYDNDQEVDKIETVVTGIPVENEDLFMKFLENLNGTTKRILGTSLAIFSGILYAFTFTPALYIQDNSDKFPGASDDALDYVFSLYTGIYISSISYFIIYCMIKKNKPNIQPEVVLPALISGGMWGIGNSCFFLANNALSQAVTFPIVSSGPSAIASLWGIVLYKEIKGMRNFVILGIGFLFALAGSILTGLSK